MKKKMVKRLFALAMVSVMAVGLLSGCSLSPSGGGSDAAAEESGEKEYVYRVGFVNIDNADNCCYPAMQKFVDYVESDEFAEAVGADKVEALTADSAKDIEKQTTNVETLLSKGVDMMFIIGVDTEGNTTAVQACNNENVPVFMVGTEASGGDWKFIGFDEKELGQRQGEWCAKNLPENANICYLQGTPGREAAVLREEGFMEGISSRDDLTVLSSQTGEFETATAMQVTEDWIQTYGDEINAIVAADGKMVVGAVEALKAANMDQNVTTVGVVSVEDDGYLIENGEQSYAVFVSWPEIGTLCGQIAEKVYNGEEIDERTNIEMFDMTQDNYAELIATAK
ncbi:MAG: sugar ABC transporter substrate-binding protein [Ruminococcus sp.]|jgi:inositol transport system substrate-binding protein